MERKFSACNTSQGWMGWGGWVVLEIWLQASNGRHWDVGMAFVELCHWGKPITVIPLLTSNFASLLTGSQKWLNFVSFSLPISKQLSLLQLRWEGAEERELWGN